MSTAVFHRKHTILFLALLACLMSVSFLVLCRSAEYPRFARDPDISTPSEVLLYDASPAFGEISLRDSLSADTGNADAVSGSEIPGRSEVTADMLDEYQTIHQLETALHEDDVIAVEPARPDGNQDGRELSALATYTPPVNPYLNKTVMGFAPYWSLATYMQDYRYENMSVIAYFAVGCYSDGSLVKNDTGWSIWNSATMTELISNAHAKGAKVVLTVRNFDSTSIEQLIANDTGRARLVENIIAQIAEKHADGVNIDFEYRGTPTSTRRAQFASFMDQIADAVHGAYPGSHVSTDIYASSAVTTYLYDVSALGMTSLDAIMVMSYDFYTTSYYAGKFGAPESPLYGNQYWYTVAKSMADISAKAPASKVLMGVPYYGLEFPVTGATWSTKNGLYATPGPYAAISTYRNVTDPEFDAWHNASSIQWDEAEKMTWYRYRWPNASTGPEYWQGYYDDARSLGAKYQYVLDHGLGGIAIWALGYDYGRTELWDAIRDTFSKEPILVVFKDGVSRDQQHQINAALGAQLEEELSGTAAVIVSPVSKLSAQLIADYRARSDVRGADFVQQRTLSADVSP